MRKPEIRTSGSVIFMDNQKCNKWIYYIWQRFLLLLIILSSVGFALAQEDTTKQEINKGPDTLKMLEDLVEQLKEKNDELMIEVDGLVVDETVTKAGKDFYDIFINNWVVPANVRNFTIEIKEKPLPSIGTLIEVYINEDKVFESRTMPRYEQVESLANYAVYVCSEYLLNYKEMQNQLMGDDLQGSGIY